MLQEDPDALTVFEWWLQSTTFDGMSGQPLGPPEWPRPGGLARQDARLVEAVTLLRTQWGKLIAERPKKGTQAPAEAPKRTRRRA